MNYKKFQKFSHFINILFNILFWIVLISGLISAAGLIYIVVNYDRLPEKLNELQILTETEISEILSFSKGYLIMCFIEFVVATGLEVWLYKTISKTAKNFEVSDTVFTRDNMLNIKKLSYIFYIMAGASLLISILAGATLSEIEASNFYLDETSLILGLVFTFIVFLFKQTARPVIRTIEITEVHEENGPKVAQLENNEEKEETKKTEPSEKIAKSKQTAKTSNETKEKDTLTKPKSTNTSQNKKKTTKSDTEENKNK